MKVDNGGRLEGKPAVNSGVFRDLTDPRLMYLKAALFLAIGLLCAAGIIAESPTLQTAVLLALGTWAFCRLYYFFFYVIEHYIDGSFRFSGLWPAIAYIIRRRR